MWNYIVPGFEETFYDVALWFIIFSVMGWFVETIYMSICNKKLTNRGYVHGPICPIYGVGGLTVHLVLSDFVGDYFTLFIVGSIFATSIEFLTAKIMIKIFNCVWWDYTNKPFNYKGIICLESSVVWGLYSIMEITFLKDMIFVLIDQIPINLGKVIVIGVSIYYIIDFVICTKTNRNSEIETEENNIMQYKY